MTRALFICKHRTDSYSSTYDYSYGSFGLMNSAIFIVNYLTSIHVQSKLSVVVDANSIDREVSLYSPTHVIIEALYVTPTKMEELLKIKKYQNIGRDERHIKIATCR